MVPWEMLVADNPELAQDGQKLLYQFGPGLAFLATLRKDGAPRMHPICPVISGNHLYAFISPDSPKKDDLLRDPRYALQAFPPPGDQTGEFYVAGVAIPVEDAEIRQRAVRDAKHIVRDEEYMFELLLERAMYTTWESAGTKQMRPVRRKWRATALAPERM